MAVRAILVDLGGTLVDFFGHLHHAQMVPSSLRSAAEALAGIGCDVPVPAVVESRWSEQKRDPGDLKVKPLEDRLSFIFGIDVSDRQSLDLACRAFMRPLYGKARRFEDAVPFLQDARSIGLRTILVSNTTWGSPAYLWREELTKLGLDTHLDGTVFCRDVGWRKPDPKVFQQALSLADARRDECLFVGDDPVWDVDGPRQIGIHALLLDRKAEWAGSSYDRIVCLADVLDKISTS